MTQTIRASIDIDAPPGLVWEVVHDPATFVEGIDWVYEAWQEGDGPFRQGSVYVERARPGPREGIYRWEITAFDPPRRSVHFHESGELRAELELRLEPLAGDRTRYSQLMRFEALPAFRPLGVVLERTVMRWRMRRDFERMILPNYKEIAERRAWAATPE